MKKKKWTKKENEIIYREYLMNPYISNILPGRTKETIRSQAWKLGITKKNRKPKWSKKEEDFIRENYLNLSEKEFVDLIPNRSWKAIRLKACSLGFKKQEPGKLSDLSILLEENPITYYWMGFLLADGHFSEYGISTGSATVDENHIQKFCKYVNYIGEGIDRCRFSGYDKEIVPKINEKFNLNNRKTYNPPYIEWIEDKDLLLAMIIGFIDGDGSMGNFYTKSEGNKNLLVIKVHPSWLGNLKHFYYFLHEYSGFDIKKKASEPSITNAGWALLSLYDNDVLAFMKRKILELELPALERKWDKVDENYISQIEREKVIWKEIKVMLDNNVAKTEIAREFNFSTKVLHRIIREN